MIEPIYDNSKVFILDNSGATIYAKQSGVAPTYTAAFESFLAATGENRIEVIRHIFALWQELFIRSLDPNLVRFYPMSSRSSTSIIKEFNGLDDLNIVGGDIDQEYNGLAGDGTSYYTTGINFSSEITDINNFSVGVYSQTDNDTGTDFGASDGTNFVTIECKNSGSLRVKVGTVEVIDTITEGDGHTILNTQSGTLKAWKGKDKAITEIGSSTPVAGSLFTERAFLGAYSASGTPTDQSTKRISCLWVYDGELDDSGVSMMNELVENLMINTGKSVNYGS